MHRASSVRRSALGMHSGAAPAVPREALSCLHEDLDERISRPSPDPGEAGLATPALPPGVIGVSGRIEGDDSAVAAKTSGRIREITAREGDRVEAGQVIAMLDDQQHRHLRLHDGPLGHPGPAHAVLRQPDPALRLSVAR